MVTTPPIIRPLAVRAPAHRPRAGSRHGRDAVQAPFRRARARVPRPRARGPGPHAPRAPCPPYPLSPIGAFPRAYSARLFLSDKTRPVWSGITRRYGASAPSATRPHLPSPPARAVCPLASRAGFCISPRAPPAFLPRFARATVSSSGALTLRCHSACYRLHRPAYHLYAVSASRPRAGAETAKNGRFCITHSGSFLKLC